MERVFDICAGCRRCFSLCNAFPTLFDAVDATSEGEVSHVDHKIFWEVVDHCYLCDLCFMTKCPYVPPHPWDVDFPHLMLRGKAWKFRNHGASLRDKILSAPEKLGNFLGIPIVAQTVNAANKNRAVRKLVQGVAGIHADAVVLEFHSNTARKRLKHHTPPAANAEAAEGTRGKVAVFLTCYGNRSAPGQVTDLIAVLEHNGIPTRLTPQEHCCGMPKLELGDFDTIRKNKETNIPMLAKLVDEGWDVVAPIPSCVLMFKQELPHLFPEDADVKKVQENIYDPFEYLMLRHKAGKLRTDFKQALGKVMYHVPCHQRVQNIGLKTKQLLEMVPNTQVRAIERCSGHNGTYAVKREFHEISMKIGRPVMGQVAESGCDHYFSDCPMAAEQIQNGLPDRRAPESAFQLLRLAYGI
ncbi:MAG: Fe-S oxidoreductase [Gammaproteobacteria bacterium]|nr:Fe-S oxidoreductase [Gammaproteobacteria bacterium]MDE1886875.1 Fe-S oxidoreductase [Gammaproteobacteria bacterium]MDE2022661.1 Fe-S oxidoreductase [Gammaproteobacteria bacterium]MDE2273179.1 Fe-S oxidoreductase [Gammaproteobacteria bacterium]